MDEDMLDSQRSFRLLDWEIEVDYSDLDVDQGNDGTEVEQEFQDDIKNITIEIERMTPNLSAVDRLDGVENRLKETEEEFDAARKESRTAKDKFAAVKQKWI